jgi:hypothetical protein
MDHYNHISHSLQKTPWSMIMETDHPPCTSTNTKDNNASTNPQQEKRHRCIFDLPPSFFDSCHLLSSPHSFLTSISEPVDNSNDSTAETLEVPENDEKTSQKDVVVTPRWTCNTCKVEFESLQDQRSHFKSDIHRFNVNRIPYLSFSFLINRV